MELVEVFHRHVDAPTPSVLSDILEVFHELQCNAHLVGPLDSLLGGDLEYREHQMANRRCGQHAVFHQFVEGRVARHDLIDPIGLDETYEMAEDPDRDPESQG